VPSVDSAYVRVSPNNAWSGQRRQHEQIVHDGKYGAGLFYAEWTSARRRIPMVELYSRFAHAPTTTRGPL